MFLLSLFNKYVRRKTNKPDREIISVDAHTKALMLGESMGTCFPTLIKWKEQSCFLAFVSRVQFVQQIPTYTFIDYTGLAIVLTRFYNLSMFFIHTYVIVLSADLYTIVLWYVTCIYDKMTIYILYLICIVFLSPWHLDVKMYCIDVSFVFISVFWL